MAEILLISEHLNLRRHRLQRQRSCCQNIPK